MAYDNPNGPDGDGNGGRKPTGDDPEIALAINALSLKYETAHKDRARHDDKVLFWSRFTGSVVAVYTLLTVAIAAASVWSSWNSQRAVDLTAENFIVDQRPYIWLTNDLGSPTAYTTQSGQVQVLWTWHYTNYGKTPALEISFEQTIRLGPENQFISPYGYKGYGRGSPLPPNKDDHVTVVSAPLNAGEAANFAAEDHGITIAATIVYKDGHERSYKTRFCIGRLKVGDIAYERPTENCHNDMN